MRCIASIRPSKTRFLPHVENGTVILIGATTENPYFDVNKALVSRSRIFELTSLQENDLQKIIDHALQDSERGYGKLKVNLTDDARAHLLNVANGDARGVLNALELAVETTQPDVDGIITITTEIAEESIQRRAVLYDKDGDAHFDVISAFIKSVRGSDADAALYWLAKMVYAGEDPRFIFRRMLILASEDVGLADPNALSVVVSAARAFDYVGLPEGRFHLAEAGLYLATAPKSNTTVGFFDALEAVQREGDSDVPNHLKDKNRDGDDFGHGAGYLYPHAYRDHWVSQQYLPDNLQGRGFYQPSNQGYEAEIFERVMRQREAQLAAMVDSDADSPFSARLPAGPKAQNQWLQRTLDNSGAQLAALRDKVFSLAKIERHYLILDLNATTGLLTWEAVRRAPVGGVWALSTSEASAETLRGQVQNLDDLQRPVLMSGKISALSALVSAQEAGDVRFDVILGRNTLTHLSDKKMLPSTIKPYLAKNGRVVLAETMPKFTQRLYALLNLDALDDDDLAARVRSAEETIYTTADDPMVNWGRGDVSAAFDAAKFESVQVFEETHTAELNVTRGHISRWFGAAIAGERQTYAQHLSKQLSTGEIEKLKALFERQLLNQSVKWESRTLFVLATV